MAAGPAFTARPATRARVRSLRLAAVAGAVLVALLTWVLIEPVIGHDLYAPGLNGAQPENIGIVETVAAALAPALAAWAFLAVLEKFFPRRATLIWTVVAVVVLVATMPWSGTFRSEGDHLSLVVLHLVVAAVLIPALAWSAAHRPRLPQDSRPTRPRRARRSTR
ncbi:DUF6069 family protein [Actinoplanes sp. NEAU-A12]|uniref:DUF6069 family protein n=1 Tax=Actinoplanes sandaracinus TaxID=3045177 RepID=A0ABT6X1X7_9ACTN|nr:DUF6069 family protein [Actinoplanes sandaracinus]MDI6106022.1 DUF6069 family protein [Actinoplanes sandaracinus]